MLPLPMTMLLIPTETAPRRWGARTTRQRVRRAMPRGEFALFCQPTVDCMSGEVVGGEALIRWRHPTRGILAPAEWLPAVEAGALNPAFNLHVLELAVAHHGRWEREGHAVPLSVNVTPDCLADDAFVDRLEALFADRSPAGAIRLEVTERATVAGMGIDQGVARLRQRGFDFLLDDFGADHSSLSRLAVLPFTTLKIDASLVLPMTTRHANRLIVGASIEMAHALGLSVVAEGIEERSTWALLQALGCDLIQGYYVARPMPAEDFPGFVADYVPQPPQAARRSRTPASSTGERRSGRERRTAVDRRAGVAAGT